MSLFVETIENPGKPSLTLLHGWGLNGAVWDGIRDTLAAHFTLHIIDLPGHGHSRDVALTTIEAATDLITDFLRAEGIKKTHLLGWSLGGQFALTMALRHSEIVEKLLLVSTTPRFSVSDDWAHGVSADVLDDFAANLTKNYATTIRGFLALQALHQPDARVAVSALQRAMSLRSEPSAASLQAGLNMLRSNDLREPIGRIAAPTLVIQGGHDALTKPAAADWLAKNLPYSTFVMIEHAAHAPFLSHQHLFLEHVMNHLQTSAA